MHKVALDILEFWFKESTPEQWFQKNDEFDAVIRSRFEREYDRALNDEFDDWINDAQSSLALIVLLDQFSRNMYRDTPKMFSGDEKALQVAKYVVDKQYDDEFNVSEKAFCYLPFEHSEDIIDQETSLKLYEKIQSQNPTYYLYAKKHYDVIKEFGRFPHRNAILGRDNTPEEEVYLAQPGSGF